MTDNKFRLEIIEKFSGLITAGFGLVAALAWNTAIQNLFTRMFGTASSLTAQFAYAVLITLLVVFVTYRIGKVSQTLKERVDKEEEGEWRIADRRGLNLVLFDV